MSGVSCISPKTNHWNSWRSFASHGQRAMQRCRRGGVEPVLARHQPVGRALEDRELGSERRDLRHELHRARRIADHGDALAGEVHARGPSAPSGTARRGSRRARDRRRRRPVQLAHAGDEELCLDGLAVGELDAPQRCARRRSAPTVTSELKRQCGSSPGLHGALDRVAEQLRLPGEAPAPVGLLREREAVEERGRVTGGAGVGVVAPRAAERGRPSRGSGNRRCRRCFELHAHADAGVAGADDRDARAGRHGGPCRGGSIHQSRFAR